MIYVFLAKNKQTNKKKTIGCNYESTMSLLFLELSGRQQQRMQDIDDDIRKSSQWMTVLLDLWRLKVLTETWLISWNVQRVVRPLFPEINNIRRGYQRCIWERTTGSFALIYLEKHWLECDAKNGM